MIKEPLASDEYVHRYEDIGKEKAFYTIQVHSWKDKAKALHTLDVLRLRDYPAYIVEKKNQKGEPRYKLRFGKYVKRSEAEQAATDFKKTENKDFLIIFTHTPTVGVDTPGTQKVPAVPPRTIVSSTPPRPTAGTSPAVKSHWYNKIEKGDRYFTIQVYSWRDKTTARQSLAELREKGYSAYVIERKNSKGEELCKIRFGKYPTRAGAEKMAAAFNKSEMLNAIVVASNIKISL